MKSPWTSSSCSTQNSRAIVQMSSLVEHTASADSLSLFAPMMVNAALPTRMPPAWAQPNNAATPRLGPAATRMRTAPMAPALKALVPETASGLLTANAAATLASSSVPASKAIAAAWEANVAPGLNSAATEFARWVIAMHGRLPRQTRPRLPLSPPWLA
ncbi:hypothetical protein Golomagni_06759 [Golovinomyces magnicellulatus]|nr:hypothetical protein Golomagni_06759 [Golovinomyces magnicellulatus]